MGAAQPRGKGRARTAPQAFSFARARARPLNPAVFHQRPGLHAILVVEPDSPTAHIGPELSAQLNSHGFETRRVKTSGEGVTQLAHGGVSAVLLSINLPDRQGAEAFTALKRVARETPILVLAEANQLGVASECLALGATDYLLRGSYDGRRLLRRIRREIHSAEADEALRTESTLLRALLDHVPDRIYFKDRESRFIRISRALGDLFCLRDPSEAAGRTDADFFDHAHALAALEDEQRVIHSGQPLVNRVEREELPDGRVTWALTTKVPFRAPDGRIVGTFGVSRDITELKAMEDTLEEDRNLLRALVDSVPDSIFVKDAAGRFVLGNRRVAELMGAAGPEALLGKTDFDFYERASAQRYWDDEQEILRTGEPLINREEPVEQRDGSRLWVLTTKVPYHDRAGQRVGIMGISRDITARREAEEALRHANTELERTVGALRAHRGGPGGVTAADLVKLVNATVHEVRNPLLVIAMGADLARSRLGEDAIARATLDDVAGAVRRIEVVLARLSDFLHGPELESAPVDLGAVAAAVLDETASSLAARRVELATRPAGGALPVMGDGARLRDAVRQLVTNALQAMPAGGTLVVRARAEGASAVVEVEDTGAGLPDEIRPRLFQPFVTTRPEPGCCGLGLYFARLAVERHGGVLAVVPREPGPGVRAVLRVPLAMAS